MIKKFITILSIGILSFTSIGFESYADGKYNRNLIKGNTREISMELNKSIFEKANEVFLINETALVDGISTTPLAYAKNAPIIPVKMNELDNKTKDFFKKLEVKKITIIGGLKSVSKAIEDKLAEDGYEVKRIYGDDRYQTSIKIANELDKIKSVKNIILINSSVGLENALGIYSFAAEKNIPIVWSDGKNFKSVKSYINKNKIEKVYAIGDSEEFHYKLNENINNVELIKEINKTETNLNIIKKFQKNKTNKMYAISVEYGNHSESKEYISLGVIAAKQSIPILICEESLTKPQENYLDRNNIDTLEQIGSKINDYSIYNTFTSKSFLYSMILIIVLIIMLIRAFIHKA